MMLGTADVADTPRLLCLSSAAVRRRTITWIQWYLKEQWAILCMQIAMSLLATKECRLHHYSMGALNGDRALVYKQYTPSLFKLGTILGMYIPKKTKPGHLHLHSHLPSAGPASPAGPAPTLLWSPPVLSSPPPSGFSSPGSSSGCVYNYSVFTLRLCCDLQAPEKHSNKKLAYWLEETESDAPESITWLYFKSCNAHFRVHYLDIAQFKKTNGCFV